MCIHLPVCVPVCLLFCLFLCLSVYLSIYLSVCLSILLSVGWSINHYLSITPLNFLCLSLYSGRGLQRNNLNSITTLGEIPRQYIPCPTHALQRQILCLTNRGVHILQKVRPIDYLYRFLSQDNFMESYCVRDFFALYGTVESACMCLAIACGLQIGRAHV